MSGSDRPVISLSVEDQISPGARAAADALNKVGDAATTTETKLGRVSASASTLVGRLDPATKAVNNLERAHNQLATSTETLNRALANGDITTEQYEASLATLQQRVRAANEAIGAGAVSHGQLATAMKGTSLTIGQVAPQFVQLFTSIQAGQPVLTSFLAQGHQLGDQMLVTGTSVGQLAGVVGGALRTALGAILSPIGLAVTGAALLAGGVYALGSAAFNAQSRLGDLRQGLQAYGQDAGTIIGVSNDLARSTGLSRAALDELGKTLSTGIQNFQATGAQLKNLEKLTRDFAAATGLSLQEAATKIKTGFTDPYKFALAEMQAGVKAFTSDLLVNVATLEAQGKTGEAQALVLKTLGAATAGASEPTTELGKAYRDLATAFNTAGAGGKTFTEKLGSPFISALTLAIEQVAKLAGALNNVEGGAVKAGNVLASVLNPIPGSTTAAVAGAYLTSRGGRTPSTHSPGDIYAALIKQGVPADDAARLTAISGAESGYGANQISGTNRNGTTDYGVFQVNSGAWPQLNPSSLPNASLDTQAAAAAEVYRKQGLTAWATYNSGAYQKYMGGTQGAALPSAGPSSADRGGTSVAAQIAGGEGYTASLEKQKTAIADLVAYQKQLIDSNQQSSVKYQVVTEEINKANAALQNTRNAVGAIVKPLDDQVALLNKQAVAWANGAEAAGKAAIQQQSWTDVAKIADTSASDFGVKVQIVADAYTAVANAQAAVAAAQETSKNNDQLAFLNAEVATLGQDYDTRQKILAALKEKQDLEASGKQYTDAEKQALIDQKVALVGVTDQLQQYQAGLQEVGNLATQAFDQIGSAISNSFLSGTGAAINWGNTVKAVVGTVIQSVAKLAILNPIINYIEGGNRQTLGSVLGAFGQVGGAGGQAAGGGGALGLLSNGGTLISGANTLSGGWLGNSLGITGENGLISNVGNYFSSSSIGGGLFANGTNGALAGLGQGVYGPATLSQVQGSAGLFSANGSIAGFANTPLFGTATIGSALGGIGAGYGLGSLAGGYIQSGLNKTGPAPQIGAGVGALAGAAIGSIVPGVGTLIGGALGGLLGGAGGGFIGPHVATPYSNIEISAAEGQLKLGKVLSQGEDPTGEIQQAQAYADAINTLRGQSGIGLVSTGGINRIGNPVQAGAPGKATDVASAFSGFRFGVADTSTDQGRILASQVNDKSFADINQLSAVFTEVSTFVSQTVPALKAFDAASTGIGSFATAINNLHNLFDPAISEAQKLGYAEQDLTDARDKAVVAAQAQAQTQIEGLTNSIQASFLAAHAQVTGSKTDAQTAALYGFDNVTALQGRQQLKDQFQGIFGDAYTANVQYVSASVALEQSLAEQRLAIQKQYADTSVDLAAQAAAQATDRAQQAAGASVSSLLAYVQKLQGSDVSPLSPLDQYGLAKNQFNAVSGAARAGDYNSITNLPTYADALLSASRNVNGSGAGYVNDYNSVLSSVSSVAALGPDALTQSFMAAQLQSQTAAIVTAIQSLQSEVASLQGALENAARAPARIAA